MAMSSYAAFSFHKEVSCRGLGADLHELGHGDCGVDLLGALDDIVILRPHEVADAEARGLHVANQACQCGHSHRCTATAM